MITKQFLATVVILALAAPLAAQQTAPPDCSAPEHRQFDFWIGDWNVTGPQGQVAGTNRIEATMSGCALIEHWTSANGVGGVSLNFYDRLERKWFQSWIDERGGPLHLAGGLADGNMVMQADPVTRPNGQTVISRVTWSKFDDGRVRQLWESSSDDGKTWTVAFDGTYARKR